MISIYFGKLAKPLVYIDELLVIKGRALNTANFTPPTAPYF